MSSTSFTATQIVEDIKRTAYAKAQMPYNPPAKVARPTFVPMSVHLDREGTGGSVREAFLWKLGAPGWDVRGVAAKLCIDLGLPHSCIKLLENELTRTLSSYTKWKDLGGEKRVLLQVFVRHGLEVLQDEVEWDLNQPLATAARYACDVCAELRLSMDWFTAISRHVQSLLDEQRQDLALYPEAHSRLLPPIQLAGTAEVRQQKLPNPRLMPYVAADDKEVQRQAQRRAEVGPWELKRKETDLARLQETRERLEASKAPMQAQNAVPHPVPVIPAPNIAPPQSHTTAPAVAQAQPRAGQVISTAPPASSAGPMPTHAAMGSSSGRTMPALSLSSAPSAAGPSEGGGGALPLLSHSGTGAGGGSSAHAGMPPAVMAASQAAQQLAQLQHLQQEQQRQQNVQQQQLADQQRAQQAHQSRRVEGSGSPPPLPL